MLEPVGTAASNPDHPGVQTPQSRRDHRYPAVANAPRSLARKISIQVEDKCRNEEIPRISMPFAITAASVVNSRYTLTAEQVQNRAEEECDRAVIPRQTLTPRFTHVLLPAP